MEKPIPAVESARVRAVLLSLGSKVSVNPKLALSPQRDFGVLRRALSVRLVLVNSLRSDCELYLRSLLWIVICGQTTLGELQSLSLTKAVQKSDSVSLSSLI